MNVTGLGRASQPCEALSLRLTFLRGTLPQLTHSLHRALGGTHVLGRCLSLSYQTKQLGGGWGPLSTKAEGDRGLTYSAGGGMEEGMGISVTWKLAVQEGKVHIR